MRGRWDENDDNDTMKLKKEIKLDKKNTKNSLVQRNYENI